MTYNEKRAELLAYLAGNGWTVHTKSVHTHKDLKVPYAVRGEVRLNFRRQAIYQGEHSLESDMKQVDGPGLVKASEQRSQS